jgi:hypothetical protein
MKHKKSNVNQKTPRRVSPTYSSVSLKDKIKVTKQVEVESRMDDPRLFATKAQVDL